MSGRLPTRPLGSSGLDITPVGFGAWAIGGGDGASAGVPRTIPPLTAMRPALELGVNWIDTAAVYGLGHSEELSAVGRLLRELPQTSDLLSSPRVGDPRSGG
jgi:aryl-alcohol dehydrogenase-like predicted oxidoreductase